MASRRYVRRARGMTILRGLRGRVEYVLGPLTGEMEFGTTTRRSGGVECGGGAA